VKNTATLTILAVVLASLTGCGKKDQPKPQAAAARPGAPPSQPVREGLWITDPQDSTRVPYRPYVLGTISDTTIRSLYLVVHPLPTREYWVQPPCGLRADGAWMGQPYIGLENTPANVGFEIRAVADPPEDVVSGKSLKTWPEARYRSNVVVVFRQ
jgi:hypothetical protein